MAKGLTDKEKLFCTYLRLGHCGREAAAKSGYRNPERAAMRLLQRADVQAFLAKEKKTAENTQAEVLAGYRRLAFGSVSDAVRLLLRSDEADPADPETLDLFSVAELKRPKGGGLEIKFFDRLKALERMEQLSLRTPNESAAAFFAALGGAAQQTEPTEGLDHAR